MNVNYKINIPIFITVRGDNDNAIKRNKEALKYSYIQIRDANLFSQTFIISDNIEMIEYAKKLGFINFIHHECKDENDISYLDYYGIYDFHKQTGYIADWFILLAVNQLFRSTNTILEIIKNIDDSYDVIASYTTVSNRSQYFVDIIKDAKHLITHERDRRQMIDSSIFAIQSSFAIKCIESKNDPAEEFWNGKFKFVENTSPYTDVYDINDINKYSHLGYIIKEVKKIKVA